MLQKAGPINENFMNNRTYNRDLNSLYKTIKLGHQGGSLYPGRDLKLNQLQDYKVQMDAVLRKVSKKQVIHLVESCAGNCYLSFYLAWMYKETFSGKIIFTCIERNERLMEEARKTAEELGLQNMSFIAADVHEVFFREEVHIVYSLHACDLATDATIALGVLNNARYILSVSCCQHTMHKKIKGHPLTAMTQHGVYKEMLASMVGDSMRGSLIALWGYKANIFAFTANKNTGRNIMLRGERTQVSGKQREEAYNHYENFRMLFKTRPALEELLNKQGEMKRERSA